MTKSDTVAKEAARALQKKLLDAKDLPKLLLSSGGSCLQILDHLDANILDENLTISVLDERYAKDEAGSNFAELLKTRFYQSAADRSCHFIDTRVKNGETAEELASRFEKVLKDWQSNNPKGKVFATLGVGRDGHTAGIFPYPGDRRQFEKLFEQGGWVKSYNAPKGASTYPERVTVTLPFLRQAIDGAIVFAVGDDKRVALDKMRAKKGSLNETPARIVHEMKSVMLYTDITDIKGWRDGKKKKGKEKKVFVFGTFDGFHEGHRHFLRQAKNLGDYLIVAVARDEVVRKLKGRKPKRTLRQRMAGLRKERLADKVVAADRNIGSWRSVKKYRPQVIALGYDQRKLGWALRKSREQLAFIKEIKKMKPFRAKILHSSLLKN